MMKVIVYIPLDNKHVYMSACIYKITVKRYFVHKLTENSDTKMIAMSSSHHLKELTKSVLVFKEQDIRAYQMLAYLRVVQDWGASSPS